MNKDGMNPDLYVTPHQVPDVLIAFPGSLGDLLPSMSIIPEEFKNDRSGNPWLKWQSVWFYEGLPGYPSPKDGISLDLAMRHLSCIQRSFEPKHEHKVAAVAWLASRWFESPGQAS